MLTLAINWTLSPVIPVRLRPMGNLPFMPRRQCRRCYRLKDNNHFLYIWVSITILNANFGYKLNTKPSHFCMAAGNGEFTHYAAVAMSPVSKVKNRFFIIFFMPRPTTLKKDQLSSLNIKRNSIICTLHSHRLISGNLFIKKKSYFDFATNISL